jgi:ABC-type multidrug transport system fused ATPase/permease subunit
MVLSFVLFLGQIIVFIYAAIDASKYIHKASVHYIFRSTLSYLDLTPMGTLLNNLSKDCEVLDHTLPDNALYVIQQGLMLCGILILACVASPFFIIPLIPIVAIMMYLRTGYHNTAVQLKRIESTALQPIYSLFASILKGGPTIRAYGLQSKFNTRFEGLVDDYIRVKVSAAQLERRFGAYLNCIAATYIAFLSIFVVIFRSYLDTSLALLAITSSLRLVGITQVVIRFISQVTQSMTSIYRLHNLQEIPQEPEFFTSDKNIRNFVSSKQPENFREFQIQTERQYFRELRALPKFSPIFQPSVQSNSNPDVFHKTPARNKKLYTKDGQLINHHYRHHQQQSLYFWPWFGHIEFKSLCLRYRPELPLVINNLSLQIHRGQRVGVIGRTGAGKSSLFGALARLIPAFSGSIEIDGIDISQLGIGDLRSRVSIIPQTPTLFSGTIRSNLDPLTRFTDSELWNALKLVNMEKNVKELEEGLYSQVDEMGSNFAASFRQLFCIARALLAQPSMLSLNINDGDDGDGNDVKNGKSGKKGRNSKNGKNGKNNRQDNPKNNRPNTHNNNPETITEIPSPTQAWGDDIHQLSTNDTINLHDYATMSSDAIIKINEKTSKNDDFTVVSPSAPLQGQILLADEITSSTSLNDDNFIQNTIRTAFKDSTLLIIAHRLVTVAGLDRILVLRPLSEEDIKANKSSLLEYNAPYLLLNDPSSAFYQMCIGLGQDSFVELYQKAKEAFFKTQKSEFERFGTWLEPPKNEIISSPLMQSITNGDLKDGYNLNQSDGSHGVGGVGGGIGQKKLQLNLPKPTLPSIPQEGVLPQLPKSTTDPFFTPHDAYIDNNHDNQNDDENSDPSDDDKATVLANNTYYNTQTYQTPLQVVNEQYNDSNPSGLKVDPFSLTYDDASLLLQQSLMSPNILSNMHYNNSFDSSNEDLNGKDVGNKLQNDNQFRNMNINNNQNKNQNNNNIVENKSIFTDSMGLLGGVSSPLASPTSNGPFIMNNNNSSNVPASINHNNQVHLEQNNDEKGAEQEKDDKNASNGSFETDYSFLTEEQPAPFFDVYQQSDQ